jgi:cellobiose-specific phosphotransferase system component IIC
MKINSKWSYVLVGVNVMVALLGAVIHSLPLTIMGAVFTFWNYKVAEFTRSLEDETIRQEGKSKSDIKTEE